MSYPLTTRGPMPSALWAEQNPTLAQFEEGVESDTGKVKRGPGVWNSLRYLTHGNSASPLQMVTTTVQTNVGTKQALLGAVPTGMQRVISQLVPRNPSASLGAISDVMLAGFNSDANDFNIDMGISPLSDGLYFLVFTPTGGLGTTYCTTGVAGEVFGCKFLDVSITATLTIDVFFYDVPA